MRLLIIKILLRLLGRPYYKPLSERAVNRLLHQLANEEGLENLPDFLQQCADQYRNQYLYSKDERFRGTVLAFVSLRERILEKRSSTKAKRNRKILTKQEKGGKIRKAVY
jgi:hypothetical protein